MKAPILRTLFGRAEVAPPPDVEAAALRSDRFRLEREGGRPGGYLREGQEFAVRISGGVG